MCDQGEMQSEVEIPLLTGAGRGAESLCAHDDDVDPCTLRVALCGHSVRVVRLLDHHDCAIPEDMVRMLIFNTDHKPYVRWKLKL